MALGKLQIDLEARIAKFESDMGRAARILQRDMVNAQKSAERANQQMTQTMQRNAQRIEQSAKAAAAVVGTVFAARMLVQYAGALSRVADGYANVQAKVRLAAGENANLAGSFDKVFGVAQRTFNSLDGTAALVQRGSMALQNFGQDADTAFSNSVRLAEIFNKSLVVSGASAENAAAAALQFSQALASGRFQGDEFRSVMENNSRFAQLLADSLGVNIAQLRDMSKEGKLTTQSFLELLNKTGDLDKQFAGMPLTIGRAKTLLDNAFTKFIGQGDQARGVSRSIAAGMASLADNLGPVVSALANLGIVAAGAFAGRGLLALKAYTAGILEQAAAAKVLQASTQQKAVTDAAAAQQALLKARGDQIAAESSAAAAAVDRQRIQTTIAMSLAQESVIRANALRATSEIELALLSERLTALEGARAAATAALGAARQAEVRANVELLASNRALQAAYAATGTAGAAAAAKITIGMRAAAVAQGAMTVATRAFTGALALVGGPLGVVIIGVGLLANAFANASARADQAAQSFKNAIQSSNNFMDNQSAASALQAGQDLLASREALRARQAELEVATHGSRNLPSFLDIGGLAAKDREELRVVRASLVEVDRQLALNRQQIEKNSASWAANGEAVASSANKYEKQHAALDKEHQQLVAQRLELTQGVRARLEYEAMQEQGVKTAAELDAGTRSRIDALVKERAAIDGAKESRRAGTKADKEAEAQKKRDASAAYQFSKALSELSEQMGGDLHAAQEQYNQDLAKFEAIAKRGAVSAEDMAKAKAMLDERLAQTTGTIQAGIEGPQAEAALEYARALKLVHDNGRALGISEDVIAEAERRLGEEFHRTTLEIERRLDPAAAMLDDMEFELDLLGLSNAARQTAIQLRQLEGQATGEQVEAMLRLNQAYETQSKNIRMMDDIRGSAVDAGVAIAKNFNNAGDAIKDFFDRVQEQILRRIIEGWIDQLLGQQGTTGEGTTGGGWLGSLISGLFGSGASAGGGGNTQWGAFGPGASGWTGTSGASAGGGASGGSWWATALSWIGGLFAGSRASGGPVMANKIYEVNENFGREGPETLSVGGKQFLLMGNQSGNVTPSDQSDGTNVQNNKFYFAAPTSMKTQTQLASRLAFEQARARRFGA